MGAKLEYNYTFSDKEDYLFYDDEQLFIISNTNTLIDLNFSSYDIHVRFYPSRKFENKIFKLFKNFSKDNRSRSFISDHYFFRASEVDKNIQFEMIDLDSEIVLLDTVLTVSEILEHPLTTDKGFRKTVVKEDSYKALLKGKMAFRVFEEKDHFILNVGRDFDRLFELDYGYFELKIDKQEFRIMSSDGFSRDLHNLRISGQNLDYEFLEIIYQDKLKNLKLLQYNKKEKNLKIMD